MSKIRVLTGAGISAESGIKTFRDAGGLWEGYRVEEVATPEGWHKHPKLVLDFYNERRKQLSQVKPNDAHIAIASLDIDHEVVVITQNVDDLHERAGSKHIIHLHGELLKARSSRYEELIYDCHHDIQLGDNCEKGFQLRPHIVWFGEMVPMLEPAITTMLDSEIVFVIGSSMQVYPAASLVAYAPRDAVVYYIDPNPKVNFELQSRPHLKVIAERASIGVPNLIRQLGM